MYRVCKVGSSVVVGGIGIGLGWSLLPETRVIAAVSAPAHRRNDGRTDLKEVDFL